MNERLRRARAQLRGAGQLLRTAATSPELRREIVRGLSGGPSAAALGGSPSPADLPPHQMPSGLNDFTFDAHAAAAMTSSAAETVALLTDPTRFGDWLTMHGGWRGDPPAGPVCAGQTFTQQALVVGLAVDIEWTVAAASDTAVELRGRAPMGVNLAFWLTVRPHGSGSCVFFDAGVEGQPLKGPMGATVVRNLNEGLGGSLVRLADLLGGPAGARSGPVLHERSGVMLDPTTPVVVGVGQITQREPGTDDPVALSARALRAAAADSGAGEHLLRSADAVYAVPSISWTYRDQAARLAAALGAQAADTAQSSPLGGDGPQLLINSAAQAIADGEARVVLIAGAEAGASLAAAQKSGVNLHWPAKDSDVRPHRVLGVDRPGNNDVEIAAGLGAPIFVYALIENAVRAARGRGVAEHRAAIGALWSRFSAAAARNPYAWQSEQFDAGRISAAATGNRMISAPYTKLMCANMTVDEAAGLIVCSAAAATEAGIPQDKWVFLHAGASGQDEWFVSERASLAASPAIRTLGAATLGHAGLSIDDITHIDLYSCFPAAVQIAAEELGLATDDPARPLTVTGGLTFGGGPGNNYGCHGVASLVAKLRAHPSTFGLATSLGWYATKHAIGIYSATPPARRYAHLRPIIENPPMRPARGDYVGDGVLESYTVPYTTDGAPEAAILSIITPDGARALCRTAQPDIIAVLTEGDPIRQALTVRADGAVTLACGGRLPLPAPPASPVLVERRGAIMVITLNRPETRNAIDRKTAEALEHAIDIFEADPALIVAVLTGAGATFCSGMDLNAAARGEYPIAEKRGLLGLAAAPPVKPLIAAVEGHALAGGCELALAADLIVAAADSQFGIPEPKRGLVAAAGWVMRLADRLPRNIAMQLALTGDPMPATTLAAFGLVNEIAPPGKSLEVALALAERIARNAPMSVRISKQIVGHAADWTSAEAFDRQAELAVPVVTSEDAAEGMRAFNQKRPPIWKGR